MRRHACVNGSFEWYVLNGHTRRHASKFFPTSAKAAAERARLQARLDLAKAKVLGRTEGRELMPLTMRPTGYRSGRSPDWLKFNNRAAGGFAERGPAARSRIRNVANR